jgi:hypothetical protein
LLNPIATLAILIAIGIIGIIGLSIVILLGIAITGPPT